MMTGMDVLTYYLNHPPFEVTDKVMYAEFLQSQADFTMLELSETFPIMSEIEFTTDAAVGDETYVFFDLSTLHDNYMEMIYLERKDQAISTLQYGLNSMGYPVSFEWSKALNSGSVLNYLALNDYVPILEEWYKPKFKKLIYDGKLIKLLPATEYYSMFWRYKTVDELQPTEIRTFQRLVHINLMLSIYQSDIFSSEGGIRSVSLSGLSVSFNVPEAANKVKDLLREKDALLGQLLDYDDGCVGLI